jgi:hypothetical protein
MSSKKQTAVDYLVESIFNESELQDPILKLAITLAKAIEKDQIIDAYREGRTDQQSGIDKFYNRSSASYYTSTYGS